MAVDLSRVDDDAQYKVKVSKPISLPGPTQLTPSTVNVVKGRVLKALPSDSVVAFERA